MIETPVFSIFDLPHAPGLSYQPHHPKRNLVYFKNMYIIDSLYVKCGLFFLARCSPATACFLSHFRPRGKLACHGYIMERVWISAELRGGARRIKRRLAGSIWLGIAFRLPETSRSLGTPKIVVQILIICVKGKVVVE